VSEAEEWRRQWEGVAEAGREVVEAKEKRLPGPEKL
jgi:hypothetical protein